MQVTTREQFILFIDQLRAELLTEPETWENKTLPQFLEAISAYANDIQEYYNNMQPGINADVADWQVFAFLMPLYFRYDKIHHTTPQTPNDRYEQSIRKAA